MHVSAVAQQVGDAFMPVATKVRQIYDILAKGSDAPRILPPERSSRTLPHLDLDAEDGSESLEALCEEFGRQRKVVGLTVRDFVRRVAAVLNEKHGVVVSESDMRTAKRFVAFIRSQLTFAEVQSILAEAAKVED